MVDVVVHEPDSLGLGDQLALGRQQFRVFLDRSHVDREHLLLVFQDVRHFLLLFEYFVVNVVF